MKTDDTTKNIIDAMHQAGMASVLVEDMNELALRIEYHHLLKDRSKPLPLPFEQWKSQRILTNPETYKAIEREI